MKLINMKKNKKIIFTISLLGILGMTTFSSAEINHPFMINTIEIATPSEASVKSATATPSDAEKIEIDTYTGFRKDKNGTMYFIEGTKVKNSYAVIRKDLYRFDENGYMIVGWFYDNQSEEWYYFDADGTSVEGWIYVENEWYYLEDGKYITGWKEIQSEDGNSYWFYFNEDGRMYKDEQTPDGYYVNEDGVYIKGPQITGYDDSDFEWNKDPNTEPEQLSGLSIAGYPAELYMLCIAGETSGMSNISAVKNGDKGSAYGICQLDYRYDLVDFIKFAFGKHPNLWPAFSKYTNYKNGNPELKKNDEIGNAFLEAMEIDYETAITDQLEFMTNRYWVEFKNKMNAVGFNLDERNIAVSAALFSVNVNCGTQPNVFINHLSTDMSDEEMIRGIYKLRNTVFARQKVGKSFKGTTTRYRKSEPQMALDLLYGYITIDSDVRYGGGVEWHGNPFTDIITTVQRENRVLYASPELPEFTLDETEVNIASNSEAEKELKEIPEAIVESENQETLNETETSEEMVQLIDGSWILKSQSGPGYEYMPTDDSDEIEESNTITE